MLTSLHFLYPRQRTLHQAGAGRHCKKLHFSEFQARGSGCWEKSTCHTRAPLLTGERKRTQKFSPNHRYSVSSRFCASFLRTQVVPRRPTLDFPPRLNCGRSNRTTEYAPQQSRLLWLFALAMATADPRSSSFSASHVGDTSFYYGTSSTFLLNFVV